MKHKVLAILLCLSVVLTMALPGTLAVSADEDSSESQLTLETCTCGAEDDNHAEDCPLYIQPEPSEEETVCTCGAEDDTHAEDCPLYVDPETEQPKEESVCTCGTEGDDHAEDCPLYTQPEAVEEKPEGELPAWIEPYSPLTGVQSFLNVAPLMNMQSLMTLDDYGRAGNDNGDVVLNKTAKANTDDSFTITLEAYATGASHTESHYDPADIVLVLDTSGSMNDAMSDEDFEPVYISSNSSIGTNETRYILQDGKYVKVYYTGSRWAILSNGKYGNEVIPKSSQNDNTTNYVRVFDGIDTSKTYYVQFTKNNQITYQSVTYQTAGGRNGWYTAAGQKQTPRTDSSSSEGTIFYQQQQNTQFYNLKANGSRLYHLKSSVNSFIDSVLTTSPESSIAIVNFGSEANTAQGFTNDGTTLKNAVNALTANGATKADAGMKRAEVLLEGLDATHNEHKKVVIMFTDGVPTSKTAFEADVANSAISAASEIKSGATVYTIGVFDGANGALSSFGTSDVNKYMHLVSSNYPNATSMTDTGSINSELNGKSYYLSASNSTELMNIFQLISQEVGGATNTTLGTETVIKDIIAPSFTVPANTSDIKIYTADCTGAGLTFDIRTKVTSGITTTITGNTLDAKGFDFSANWCGDHSGTYSGKKLIIEFTVSPKTGFLGGNDVPTNGEASGMYSNGSCIGNFEVPTVNVPIQSITITANDKNVYLTQIPTAEQLKSDVTIKCGDVDITDLSKLEDWQTAYVNIRSSFTHSEGFNATADGKYTVTATVSPKIENPTSTEGTKATKQEKAATKAINVFKPELTYKDSEVYYGDTAPTSYVNNLTDTQWKHDHTLSTAVTMIGNAPALTMDYTPETGKIVDNKIATKKDFAVDVAVKIGTTDVTDHTTFQHTDCTGKTCGTPANGKFWLHVNTCSLTITKTGGAADESYVFDVYKDGVKYTEVTIWGNGSETLYELPVGSYTIQENTGWSWRYSANYDSAEALSAQTPSGSITCTNTSTTNKWLNGFSTIVKNIYGKTSN